MRALKTYSLLACVLWAGVVVAAQVQKVTTPEEFDKVMKSINAANGSMGKAVKSSAYADAKTALATVRQNLALAETFWVEKKKEDAIGFSKDARAKADALDKALGASTVDPAAVMAAAGELGGACRTCHMAYRIRDAENNWIINPEKIK